MSVFFSPFLSRAGSGTFVPDRPHLTLNRGPATIAYHHTAARGEGRSGNPAPEVLFLGGFHSSMAGIKAVALEAWAVARGIGYTRFDYQGHGASSGDFVAGTVGIWIADALAVLDAVTTGPVVVVGSSMGAWIGLHLARIRPGRVAGLVGVAAAPDFTETLIRPRLTPAAKAALAAAGVWYRPSAYEPDPYPISQTLLDEARNHCLLNQPLALALPVRLLHGLADTDVPWQTSLKLMDTLTGGDVRLILIKDGDHRLSRQEDITLLQQTVGELHETVTASMSASRTGE